MMSGWFTKKAIYSEPRLIHTHAIYSLKALIFAYLMMGLTYSFDLNSGENEFVTYYFTFIF